MELYRSLFFGTGEGVEDGSISILEAMVVLWGTEKVLTPIFPFLTCPVLELILKCE